MPTDHRSLNKLGHLSFLASIVVYTVAFLLVAFYVLKLTSDKAWGPGGNYSYIVPSGIRLLASLAALAFFGHRLGVNSWRYFRSPTNL
jgi:hypothetical protein